MIVTPQVIPPARRRTTGSGAMPVDRASQSSAARTVASTARMGTRDAALGTWSRDRLRRREPGVARER